ncbi:MAG TPA: hypothetical protein ENJ95_21550 [Bacteroidetes bacterium]|nr:hypothetical protein [Bacteroidota bacterium]
MKNFIKSISLLLAIFTITNIAAAQYPGDGDLASANVYAQEKSAVFNAPIFVTNVNDVIMEVSNYLDKNIEYPIALAEFYNSDVTVTASFIITENGELENITIQDHGNKTFGKQVEKQLKSMPKVAPVIENGKAVSKAIIIPVVFEKN